MILLNTYGKISRMIVSKKLGVGISNPSDDWVSGFKEDIQEEMLIREHNLLGWENKGLNSNGEIKQYSLSGIVKAAGWTTSNYYDDVKNKEIIARNLISIEVVDFNKSYLRLKNNMLDSPTCEPQYPKKYIHFCRRMMMASSSNGVIKNIPFVIYDSDDIASKTLILNYLTAQLNRKIGIDSYRKRCISSLVILGQIIDKFIESTDDFWMFDYITDSLFYDNSYNAYHIFKVVSLIEMLIINNKKGKMAGQLENKLPIFMEGVMVHTSKRTLFTTNIRKLRNKIAHGDFRGVQCLLEEYRKNFMDGYGYDEFEYSIENWTYLNICCNLDNIVNEIIWRLITDKKEMKEIQLI